ncbi:hypothetical protein MKX01_003988 [Papaver californicum]|nr:hypothetical protein MKX01_003988 [Papaver californicum]
MDGQGGTMARIPKDSNKQIINQLQTISRKLTEFQTKFKELGNGYPTVATTSGAIQGAAFGGLVGAVAQVAGHVFPEHSPAIKAFSSSPMEEARILAAMEGARASITCIIKRIKGKEDVQTRFWCWSHAWNDYAEGFLWSSQCSDARGFQLGQKTSQLPGEYTRTSCMLSNLGLQNYEKNFKKGLLTDIIIHLLTDSVLRDVRVPPGPRLLILDHIARDPELQKMRQRLILEDRGSSHLL